MKVLIGVAAIGMLACAGPVWAQASQAPQAPQSAPAAAQPASPGAPTDAEVQSFARATVQLHALAQPTPEQMAQVITGAGLAVGRYNEIVAQMQADPAFQNRVNAALVSAQAQAQAQAQVQGTTATAAGAPAAAPAPPPLPTSGVGASVLGVLDKVCLPMVRQDLAVSAAAPQAGLRLDKKTGAYTGVLGQAPHRISVLPRGSNQKVCSVEMRYPLDSGDEIAKALNIWSMHQPQMKMVRNDVAVGADGLKRITLTWEQSADGRTAGLAYVRVQRPDGTPVEKGVGSATLLYSEHSS